MLLLVRIFFSTTEIQLNNNRETRNKSLPLSLLDPCLASLLRLLGQDSLCQLIPVPMFPLMTLPLLPSETTLGSLQNAMPT